MSDSNADEQGQNVQHPIPRRTFLRYLTGGIAAFVGIVVGAPAVGYITAPLRRTGKRGDWVSLGPVDKFADGTPTHVQFTAVRKDGWVETHEARACWVVPGEGRTYVVFNGHCTHLGCAYSWVADDGAGGAFRCPCHDGVFARDGRVVSGPPPRPLDRLDTKVENGVLSAFYQDFRLGVSQKAPL